MIIVMTCVVLVLLVLDISSPFSLIINTIQRLGLKEFHLENFLLSRNVKMIMMMIIMQLMSILSLKVKKKQT